MNFQLNTLEDTRRFAQAMAQRLQDQTITIVLEGDLGAGKTAWTRFFGQALGVKRTINSPTFTIMKSYKTESGWPLYHMDAYRLEGASQDLGFDECFESGLCVVEWPRYIADQLPEDRISIELRENEDESRSVTMEAHGEKSRRLLEGFAL